MEDEKIQISWNDLKTAKVEKHVRQQQALGRNRKYAQMTAEDLPDAQKSSGSLWYNPIFLLAVFGFVGGMLAWGGSAAAPVPDRQRDADEAMASIQDIRQLVRTTPNGQGITQAQADAAIGMIVANAGDNTYLKIELQPEFTPQEKQERIAALQHDDYWKNLITHIISFGLCGIFISISLSAAEPIIDRNQHAAVINGSVGAALGLAGGLAASLLVDRIYSLIGGADHGLLREYLGQTLSWCVLGCFLSLAPGVIAMNRKRLVIGLAGGALGGAGRNADGSADPDFAEPGIRTAGCSVLHRRCERGCDRTSRAGGADRVAESSGGCDRRQTVYPLSKSHVYRLGARLSDLSLPRSRGGTTPCDDSSAEREN